MDITAFQAEGLAAAKGAYRWEVPGKPVSIEIDFDVVDRLGAEVMRGFGATLRRGVEVGGILLGAARAGEKLVAHIEDFEPVPARHLDGAAYVLGEDGRTRLREAIGRWQTASGRRLRAIGYFRSHTREGLALTQDDIDLLDEFFPEDSAIALLVKPYATRPSSAGFFFREEGLIRADSTYQEFPFRRGELGGGEEPRPARPANGVSPAARAQPLVDTGFDQIVGFHGAHAGSGEKEASMTEEPDPLERSAVPPRSLRLRGGWVWIPLSFIFLLLGTVLGFQIALSVQPKIQAVSQPDPYTLRLTASPTADAVHLRWDRRAPAILQAQRGVLTIDEEGKVKKVELDIGHLQNGSVIYRRVSTDVSFRLEVFTDLRSSVAETVEFRTIATEDNGAAQPR